MLTRMRRNHTREAYLELVSHIRDKVPGVALSSDFICGFCDETEEEFEDTISLIETVKYDMAYLFAYSMRERTHAHRRMQDNIPEAVKKERLTRMIDVFKENQLLRQKKEIGKRHLVMVDGAGRMEGQLSGVTDTNKRAVFQNEGGYGVGDMVEVIVGEASQNTLICEAVCKSSVEEFATRN